MRNNILKIKPEPTERAKEIFQEACNVENMEAKFGRVLSQDENYVRRLLDQVDAIHLDNDKTNIVAAYPFSGSETSHQVYLKRKGFKRVYTMCAVDALGMSFMFDCDVSIESLCNHCGERIDIEVSANEIISLNPKNTVVWCDMEYSCCAATSLCKNTNFFSSEKHYADWQKGKPIRKGALLPIQEVFYLGKLFFENRLDN
jgi:hypothetical protein